MSPCNTYRSFAIYFLIVILIPESPVSGFAIPSTRTTTLRSAVDQDLLAEGSALLEVKSERSKLNNEREYVKFGARKHPIKSTANVLGASRILASAGNKNVIHSTTVKLSNENDDITTPSENRTKTTRYFTFGKGDRFKTREASTISAGTKKAITSSQIYLNTDTTTDTEKTTKGVVDNELNSASPTADDFSTSTKYSEDSSDTVETHFTGIGFTTTTESVTETTTAVTENDNGTTENEKEEKIIYKIIKNTFMPQTDTFGTDTTTSERDTTKFELDTTKLNDISAETTVKDYTTPTESMVGEFSSSPGRDQTWKKYTLIERKRSYPTTETDSLTTEVTEELQNAESISSKVTLENDVSASTVTSHDNLESESTTSTRNITDLNLSSTIHAFNNVPETETEQLPSTWPLNAETTTEIKPRESLASIRAGYLDLSARQDVDDATTTELFDDNIRFNETELIGSMFEIETKDNDGLDFKNLTMAESQSQLADDAIKEELLKEAVLSDHVENSKRYSEEHEVNKVKPLDESIDDSLSVKPIGKSALYTSRSNYRPMKKIDVQPLKPYVRDPDDNSWRNESLSNLGIVFKAKNASKLFTQVLKNKTEAELNNWTGKDNKNEVPDLRERLEKNAEVRKSKKKKLNQYGEMVYNDYEAENSGETSSTPKINTIAVPVMDIERENIFLEDLLTTARTEAVTRRTTTPGVYMYKEETETTTRKPKKYVEYYDATDEEDADYLSLTKIDLKKFTTRLLNKETVTTPTPMTVFTKSTTTTLPERKPTLQYFPPRREPQKVNVNDYDSDFQRKVNMFAYNEPPKTSPASVTIPPASMEYKTTQYPQQTGAMPGRPYKPGNLAKNVYVTFPPRTAEYNNPTRDDESFNRASYVIKHFKDLIDAAVKDDYDKSAEFMPPYSEAPLTGITMKTRDRLRHMDEDYDYDTTIRKDILNRFVDNFNQNSERFKVDFPILYNSSVVHMQGDEEGKVVASSSAFLKRQYGAPRGCCDVKVELSPAYELHYYVPEQEEKEEVEKPATMPFSYRL